MASSPFRLIRWSNDSIAPLATRARLREGRAVARLYHALRQLQPWSQPAIYVGAATIAAIWIAINFHRAKLDGGTASGFSEHLCDARSRLSAAG